MAALKRASRVVVILGAIVVGFGCFSPASLYFLMLGDSKMDPKIRLASSDREVKVVVLTAMAREMTFDLARIDQELAERLVAQLRQRFKDNREKVTLVPPGKVHAFKDRRSDWQ